jgi:DNA-binding NarL/FixJ family response regulator
MAIETGTKNVIRVLVADDHPVVRMGLTMALDAQPDIEVVGDASDIDSLMARLAATRPDVVVLDLELEPGRCGLSHLRSHGPAGTRVIIYSAHEEVAGVVAATKIGVEGYLRKSTDPGELIEAIRAVHAGGTVFEPAVASKLMEGMKTERLAKTSKDALSKRELQVLHLVGLGKSNGQIGTILFISERTVKFHVSAVLSKLNARNRTEAILTANRLGILEHPSETI